MKERPILFNDEMVRAILEGRKTQTRRVVKPQPPSVTYAPNFPRYDAEYAVWEFATHSEDYQNMMVTTSRRCPYGQVGDRLWVREAFLSWYNTADNSRSLVAAFRADGYELEDDERWEPSIHMPRKFSRITLEITGIRVERVQQISDDDALAEGVWGDEAPYDQPTAIMCFETLWDSINTGDKSWEANPWVWVVEFRRIDA